MNLLRFQILVMLERLKKVTSVANELGLKQPTVSFHMKKLEEEWGVPLFEIKTGKVLLTEAGRLLHHYAAEITRIYKEAEIRFAALQQTGNQHFVIGCTDIASSILFAKDWFSLVNEGLELQMKFETGPSHLLVERLKERSIDLIVNGGTELSYESESLLHCEVIREMPLSIYMADSHPFAKAAAVPSYRLSSYPFVALDDIDLQASLRRWEEHEKVKLSMKFSTDRVEQTLSAVRTGHVLAMLPELRSPQLLSGLAGVPLTGEQPKYSLTAMWRTDYWNPALIQRMLLFLKDLLAQ
ncbi:DNA-binding transcriptional LysR family regulator [Paenibacillus taihuensis]|uniref:DNA-binding transcriptional LysR family regulator n=1 Tax=Paenibacillus taihuensis TaxID=1156355 RepID=A0A3D9RIH8_9BACL|nr:LysR family transcriptional regulator [Paenibacillus taihuensis]REE78889.1 DNA-binding transcriptional LysR family regulator [Paenibacillus taihuensis]